MEIHGCSGASLIIRVYLCKHNGLFTKAIEIRGLAVRNALAKLLRVH
jgi:hypothetical protein